MTLFATLIYYLISLTPKQIEQRFLNSMDEYKNNGILMEGLKLKQNPLKYKTIDIFTESDYVENIKCFRIPSIVKYNNSIIAFSEARINSCEDCSITGIVSKISYNNGINFSDMKWVVKPDNRGGNFVPIYDKYTNQIIAHYSRGGTQNNNKWDCIPAKQNLQIKSTNFGLTWSEPYNINEYLGKYRGVLTGPGNAGIVIKKDQQISYIFSGHYLTSYRNNGAVILYQSDDLGKTYYVNNNTFPKMDEPSILSNDKGTLVLNMRTGQGYRGISVSYDYGENWDKLYLDNALLDPICEGSSMFLDNKILFVNPNMQYSRSNLTLYYKNEVNSTWNLIQIADPSVLTDYTAISNELISINNNQYIGILWGSCKIPFPFRPWCLTGWEIKFSYIQI